MLIEICTLSDDNYAQHLGVMLASVLLHSKPEEAFHFHVLDGGINEASKRKIDELKKIKDFKISYYRVDERDLGECKVTCLPLISYYNFLPQKYLPNTSRVLFFDSDMVILNSLEEIYTIDLQGKVIAACEDPLGQTNMKRLEIPEQYFYFNTGTMLMDLDAWRRDDVLQELLQYVVDFPEKILYMDQDVMNDVLYTRSLRLPLKWNSIRYGGYTYTDVAEYKDALENPAIIHYAMRQHKPWRIDCLEPRKDEYFKVLKQTPWVKGKVFGRYTFQETLRFPIPMGRAIRRFLKFRPIMKPIEAWMRKYIRHLPPKRK